MASWDEFVRHAPDMAEVAARLWPGITALAQGASDRSADRGGHVFSVAYLATTRPDGSPRLHPFCPVIAGGRLFAAIPRTSPKGHDLRRDGRCAIHALPGPADDELAIRAVAHEVASDAETRRLVVEVAGRSGVGGMIETVSRDPLFEFEIERVDTAYWVDIGQPGTHAVRRQWRAP